MNISKFRKVLAGLSVSAMMLTQAGTIFAYSDVPSGIWYEEAVNDFMDAGYLDASQARFRGGDQALRAEFVKLVVELNGGILGTAPSEPSFEDVPVGAWYYGYIEEAAAEGWVRGDGNCYDTGASPCNARPGAKINRAESAALINRAFGLVGSSDAPQFVDNPSGQWYTSDVQTAADNCVLQGDSGRGTVRPGDNMNRAEMVVMLHRADMGLKYPDCGEGVVDGGAAGVDGVTATSTTQVEIEFTSSVDRATAEDVANYEVDGLTVTKARLTSADVVQLTFENPTVAGESYTVFVHGMATSGGEFDDSGSFTGYREVPLSSGTLEVSLNPNTPLGDTLPRGAIGVALLSADLTASCTDDILVDGITLIHEGQGSQADINNAWMSVNGARVSRTRVFDSEDQTADLRFSRPLLVEACATVTVDFMADFLSTAAINGRHNYVIELASDIQSNAQNVSGTFPVRGEAFETSAVTAGIITATYRSVTPSNIDVNDKDAVIGKFEWSVNSTEDQTFYSATLENAGTASDGDFVSIRVRRTDGTVLTDSVSQTVADYVTVTFDPPFTVLEGDKVTLEAIADIVDGAADTLQMQFEETNDIFGVGSLYGYGVNGQLYGSQVTISTSPTVSTVTINAGELTIDIDGPVTEEYTPDADDVVLANVDFVTGGEDVNVNEIYALIIGQTSTGGVLVCGHGSASDALAENIEDVELRNTVTGQTVDAVSISANTPTTCAATNTTTATQNIYRFDDFVLRDSSRWELRVDMVANQPENGDKFRAFVCSADENDTTGCNFNGHVAASTTYNFDAEGLSTGDRVTDIRPGEDVSGNFQEVAVALLTVTERALGTSDTVVENSQDISLFRFEATAGKAEDIFLTQIVLKSDSGATNVINGQDYTLWVDTDADGVVDVILESGVGQESNQVTFDELTGGGYTIPAEETVLFEVHADIAGSLTGDDLQVGFDDNNGTQTTFAFIEAEEADDGTSLSCIQVGSTTSSTTGCSGATHQIRVTRATSKNFDLKSQGTLFVIQDTTPTRSRQLLAGELGEAILRLEFRAEDEDIDVTRLILTHSGSNFIQGLASLKLYRSGESTSFATATVDNCSSPTDIPANSYCAVLESQQLVVKEGDRLDVIVRPLLNTDEFGAVNSNTGALRLVLHTVIDSGVSGTNNDTTGTGSVTARGFHSSNVLVRNDSDSVRDGEVVVGNSAGTADTVIVGNRNDTVFAKIVTIEDVNPAADGTNVPIGTNKTLAEFKFTAGTNANTLNGRNKVTLSGMIFNVASTNVNFTASNFDLFNKNDQTQEISCESINSAGVITTGTASGSFFVDCKRSGNTTVDLALDSGESVTLVLQADISNNQVTANAGSSVTVSLNDFTSRDNTTYARNSAHIHWTDSLGDSPVRLFRWIEYGETEVSSTSYKI